MKNYQFEGKEYKTERQPDKNIKYNLQKNYDRCTDGGWRRTVFCGAGWCEGDPQNVVTDSAPRALAVAAFLHNVIIVHP